jgi:hypothetical protein
MRCSLYNDSVSRRDNTNLTKMSLTVDVMFKCKKFMENNKAQLNDTNMRLPSDQFSSRQTIEFSLLSSTDYEQLCHSNGTHITMYSTLLQMI